MLRLSESNLRSDLERQLWAEVEWLHTELARRDERLCVLERRISELEVQLAKAKKNSRTSSKPPSSDIVKPPKPPSTRPDGQRKIGGQPGHPKQERAPFAPDDVNEVHTYTLEACPDCHYDGLILLPDAPRIVQQVEVVAAPVRVDEHRGLAYWCERCGKIHYAPLPPTVEKGGLIGPILTAQIAYMKGAMHASFSTIRKYARDVMGLTISRGYLNKLIQKVTVALEQPYADIAALLKSEAVLNVDETGHKDNADRFWTWCFRAKEYCVFTVAHTRSTEVLLEMLGREFEGVLGCDHFSSYRKYLRVCGVLVQFCLAHFIREIKFLTTLTDPAVVDYGNRLLEKFRLLFFAIHQKDFLAPATLTRALEAVRDAILEEAQRNVPDVKEAQLVAKRLRNYADEYFEFIQTPGIGPTNNAAEQSIRFVTIDRHITQGTRSESGRHWCERIWTVLATCTIQGRSAYDYLVEVVQAHFTGQPVPLLLPYPADG
jgi:transposase